MYNDQYVVSCRFRTICDHVLHAPRNHHYFVNAFFPIFTQMLFLVLSPTGPPAVLGCLPVPLPVPGIPWVLCETAGRVLRCQTGGNSKCHGCISLLQAVSLNPFDNQLGGYSESVL